MAFLNEEQSMIRDQAKSWVTEQAPVSAFRKMRDEGVALNFTPDTWSAMIEMGWTGIIIPEQYGGSDLGYLTFGLILEETGRQLTASPLFASALVGATSLLVAGNDAQKQALRNRNVMAMIEAGGNIYYLAKFAGIFGLGVQDVGAQQTGRTVEDFRQMLASQA